MKKIILFCICLCCLGCVHFFGNNDPYSYRGKTKYEIAEMLRNPGFLPKRDISFGTIPEGKSIYEELFRRGYFLVGSSEDIGDKKELMDFVRELGAAAVYSQGGMLWYAVKMNPLGNSGLLSAKLPEKFLRSRGIEGLRLVTAVMQNSSAYYANIQEGDCVRSFNNKVCTVNPVLENESTPIVVFRAGKELHKELVRDLVPGSKEAKELLEKNKKADEEVLSGKKTATKSSASIASGSGFFISDNGYLLTNSHVVVDAKRLAIVMPGSSETIPASLVAEDKENDLALLKIALEKTKPLVISPSFGLQRGDEIMTLGYPQPSYQGARQKATFGRVNATSGFRDDMRFSQVDLPIQEGNSGGPLLDRFGSVVGIISSRLLGGGTQNVNYALKIEYIKTMIESVPDAYKRLVFSQDQKKKRIFTEIAKTEEPSVVLVLCFR